MSNRYIPYGYKFEAGQPVLHPDESAIVREIFDRYCAGDSLKVIAEDLTHRQVEYSPGKASWDKARIKRVLENDRYIGSDEYPALIEKELFVKANLKKEQTNTNKLTLDDDIKLFKELTVCAKCGKKVTRRTDSRFAVPVSWKCPECGWSVRLSDENFKAKVIDIMNALIANPDTVVPESPSPEVHTLEGKRLLNEFHRALDSGKANEGELIKMVFQIGAANYQAIDSRETITARLMADFAKAEPSSDYQRELFQRTIRKILLSPDGLLSLELQNRHIITERKYCRCVDEAAALAERQKARVDPMYHEKIDHLLDTYARKLAANMNESFAIDARVPSILIAGGSNFPVRKKEKQNAARDRNMAEWHNIRGLLDKIRSTGMGGISTDDSQAIAKLESKLANLESAQEKMKAVNAYYRKHKTLDGCPDISEDVISKLKAGMASSWHYENKPYPSWALSNNNAEIRRVKERIASLTRQKEVGYTGWDFEGGRVKANTADNRLQIFFDDKPDEETRAALKSSGFRWAPSVGAWQRQLNDNAIYAADRLGCIRPLTGESPSELQKRVRSEQRREADEQEPFPDRNGTEEQEPDGGMQMY